MAFPPTTILIILYYLILLNRVRRIHEAFTVLIYNQGLFLKSCDITAICLMERLRLCPSCLHAGSCSREVPYVYHTCTQPLPEFRAGSGQF